MARRRFSANRTGAGWTQLPAGVYRTLWLVLLLCLLPHLFFMPVSLSLLLGAVLMYWGWRIHHEGHFALVYYRLPQYAVVLAGLALIYTQFNSFIGVDAGVAALVLIMIGKAFEVRYYRDAIVQLNFGLFVAAAAFLYSQSVLMALGVVLAVGACLIGLYQLQQYDSQFEEVGHQQANAAQLGRQATVQVLRLMALSAPLMVVLFMFVPRFPPLWSMPINSGRQVTGLSDRVAPGDLASLSQSPALAFRVTFNGLAGQRPPKSQLYWRAMTLSQFDGVAWTQGKAIEPVSAKRTGQLLHINGQRLVLPDWYQVNQLRSAVQYQLLVEPTQRNWLFVLDYSLALAPLQLRADQRIQTVQPIQQRQQFDLWWLPRGVIADPYLTRDQLRAYLQIPVEANPKSHQFAQELWQRSGQDPVRYTDMLLRWIGTDQFRYTLAPPALQQQRVDDFLFRTKAGYCEHYASAFVNLARMAGIPARVVVGYQGGQSAPDGQTWEVRQQDAHAWSEIWLAGQGWTRVDPTAAIAPQRVSLGMQDYRSSNAAVLGETSWSRAAQPVLLRMRVWADYVNYQWQNRVVGFDQNRQHEWLRKFDLDSWTRQILVMLGLFALITALIVWRLTINQRKPRDRVQAALEKLSMRLVHHHLQRLPQEPVLSWLERVRQSAPTLELLTIIELVRRHYYLDVLNHAEQIRLVNLIAKYSIDRAR